MNIDKLITWRDDVLKNEPLGFMLLTKIEPFLSDEEESKFSVQFNVFIFGDDGELLESKPPSGRKSIDNSHIFKTHSGEPIRKLDSLLSNPIFSKSELDIKEQADEINLAHKFNSKEIDLVSSEIKIYKTKLNQNPDSKDFQRRVIYLNQVIGKLNVWLLDNNFEKVEHVSELESNYQALTNEHIAAQNVIKTQSKKIQTLEKKAKRPAESELRDYIDENRFISSGKANLTKIGEILGRDPDTVKNWIKEEGLLEYANLK